MQGRFYATALFLNNSTDRIIIMVFYNIIPLLNKPVVYRHERKKAYDTFDGARMGYIPVGDAGSRNERIPQDK